MDDSSYRMMAVNGIELEVSVTNEGGEQGLAVCLHGFPEHAFSWRHQVPALVAAGYEVWVPNTRGYGMSSKPHEVSAYAMDVLLEDIAQLIDLSGRSDVTLVGHDWGAAQAWMFAIRRIRPLDGLVIMNVPHPACMRRELRTFKQLRKSWYIFAFQLPWLPEKALTRGEAKRVADAFTTMAIDKSRFPTEVTDVYRHNALQPGAARGMINYYRAALRGGRAAQREELPRIEIPTLMLWGEEDLALDKATTYGTEDHVADLTLRYLPGVSHWVQQEAPDEVNAMLLAWLAGETVPEFADLTP